MSRYYLAAICLAALSISSCSSSSDSGNDGPPAPPPPPPAQTSGLNLLINSEESNIISVVSGERSDHRILLAKDEDSISAQLSIEPATPGASIIFDNRVPYLSLDAAILPVGGTPLSVVATNDENGLQEFADVTIDVLDLVVVASGNIGNRGGGVSSRGGLVGVQVDSGELASTVNVEIRGAETSNGDAIFRIVFDRDVSANTARLSLITNESANSLDDTANTSMAQKAGTVLSQKASTGLSEIIHSYHGFYVNGARIDPAAKPLTDWSTSCSSLTVGPTPIGNSFTICARRISDAAVLSSSHDLAGISAAKEQGREIVPVLFINGYLPEALDLGGGESTWGEFRERVGSMSNAETEFVPFEFQWRTNASFRVVADDLSGAVSRVHRMTNQPLRVIAHSFGGILVRTLIQGNASTAQDFDTRLIRSVLTLGTPHSGIFDYQAIGQNGGYTFPVGQDTWLFKLCGQVSCYQIGEDVASFRISPSLTSAGEQGGVIEELKNDKLPIEVPFLVGIGLKKSEGDIDNYDDGDGLITYEGQRITQFGWIVGDGGGLIGPSLMECDPSSNRYIKEVLLGAQGSDGRPQAFVGTNTLGYSHSTFAQTGPKDGFEYSEAHIKAGEDHDSFEQFRSVVESTDSLQDPCIPDNYAPPSIPATMMGTTVNVAINWPNLGDIATIPFAAIVSDSLEFPSGIYQDANTGDSVSPIRKSSDIGADFIDIQFMQTSWADSTSFNGDVYDLLDEDSPTIVGATLDTTLSTLSDTEAQIDFDEDSVFVNFSGARIVDGDRIYVNLILEHP
jgi:hypothetical protein